MDSIGKKIAAVYIERLGGLFDLRYGWLASACQPGMNYLPAYANAFSELLTRQAMGQPEGFETVWIKVLRHGHCLPIWFPLVNCF